jgi:hypothetical protein
MVAGDIRVGGVMVAGDIRVGGVIAWILQQVGLKARKAVLHLPPSNHIK